MGKIVVLTQRGIKISEWPVNGSGLTIGRAPTNDIQINNPGVSAHHARLVTNNEQFILEDLDSRNGTYVNLDRITRKVLQNGDTINFPNCKLKFVLWNPRSKAPPCSSLKSSSSPRSTPPPRARPNPSRGSLPMAGRSASIPTAMATPRSTSWTPMGGTSPT